jgi:beta-phosphoglucomutase
MDGVLIDSRRHHLAAWHQLAREHGLQHPPDYFTQTFGLRNDAILGRLLPGIEAERLRALSDRKETLYRDLAGRDTSTLPGVRELLAWLAEQGVPKAVVTSAPRANLDLILDTLDLRGSFEALVAEEDARNGKPDPEGFLVAASRVGTGPARCVVVEDAPAGLAAAKAGGMRAVAVTTTHAADHLHDADLVVESLADAAVRSFILE